MPAFPVSKYIISIATIYFFVCVYFFFFTPAPFSFYSFRPDDLLLLVPVALCAFISLFVLNRLIAFGTITTNKKDTYQILLIVLYAAVVISVPEEILFRGLIQNYLQSVSPYSYLVILLSSAVFGIAHALNGAQDLRPQQWNWKLVAATFVAGLYLGFTYFVTRSLLMPTILHTLLVVAARVFVSEH